MAEIEEVPAAAADAAPAPAAPAPAEPLAVAKAESEEPADLDDDVSHCDNMISLYNIM